MAGQENSRILTTLDIPGLGINTYSIAITANQLQLLENGIVINTEDLSLYLDDTNLSRIVSGVLDGGTGIATFTRDDTTDFTIDFSPLFDDTNLARIVSGSMTSNFNLEVVRDDSSTIDIDITHKHLRYIQLSGSFDLFSNSNWVSWSDARFGFNQQDWDIQLGNGIEPNIDWDGHGVMFPQGATLKNIYIKYRCNNNDVDTIETFARMYDIDYTGDPAIDSNAEITDVTISPVNTVDLDAGLKDANDLGLFQVNLGDYTVVNTIADLHLCIRATPGTLTGNRQLRCTVLIEWEI